MCISKELPEVIYMRSLFVSALLLQACSTALSTMQPVQALPKGDLQFNTGVGFNVAPGPIISAFDAALAISQKDEIDINAEDEQQFLTAGLALALNPPGVINEYSFRYGLGHGFDAGLRYTGKSFNAEGKWQFLDNEDPKRIDGALHLTAGRHAFDGFLLDLLDEFDLANFSRTDVSLSAMVGKKPNDYVEFWAGPKYAVGIYKAEGTFAKTGIIEDAAGAMQYIGGTAGLALGYKYLYVITELTVANLLFKEEILGEEQDLGGVVFYPSIGLSVRVPTKKIAAAAIP
jgi:hypothetical protein